MLWKEWAEWTNLAHCPKNHSPTWYPKRVKSTSPNAARLIRPKSGKSSQKPCQNLQNDLSTLQSTIITKTHLNLIDLPPEPFRAKTPCPDNFLISPVANSLKQPKRILSNSSNSGKKKIRLFHFIKSQTQKKQKILSHKTQKGIEVQTQKRQESVFTGKRRMKMEKTGVQEIGWCQIWTALRKWEWIWRRLKDWELSTLRYSRGEWVIFLREENGQERWFLACFYLFDWLFFVWELENKGSKWRIWIMREYRFG